MRFGVVGLQTDRLLEVGDRFAALARRKKNGAQVVMGHPTIGILLQGGREKAPGITVG